MPCKNLLLWREDYSLGQYRSPGCALSWSDKVIPLMPPELPGFECYVLHVDLTKNGLELSARATYTQVDRNGLVPSLILLPLSAKTTLVAA